MTLPHLPFYTRDWLGDTGLRYVSLAAKGLWIEMLCHMWQNEARRGYLEISGQPLTDPAQIARLTSSDESEVKRLLAELESAGVFSRDGSNCIYCRRMVKQAQLSTIRRRVGALGGNPALSEGREQPSSAKSDSDQNAVTLYQAYPRHIARKDALKAINKALRAMPFEQLLERVKTYAECCRGKDPQFIPHPATWFNGERYLENPEHSKSAKPAPPPLREHETAELDPATAFKPRI